MAKNSKSKKGFKKLDTLKFDSFNLYADRINKDSKAFQKKKAMDKQAERIAKYKAMSKGSLSSTLNSKNLFLNNKESLPETTKFSTLVDKPSIKIMFLGGLNEVGKNITMFECLDDVFLLDCGMTFPTDEMLGVDVVLPDFTYVLRRKDDIKGLVITHGHEDHIGAVPYLLKQGVNVPIYATPFCIELLKLKLKEHGLLEIAKLHVLTPKHSKRFGCMKVEFINVNHSIPDAVGVAIHSPAGTIVHTGDFKIDYTPLRGEMTDLHRFAELGNEGVLALLADSTNAEKSGSTMTEKKVIENFEVLFEKAIDKRIIVASFASNISRINKIMLIAEKYKRKVAITGRSMLNYVAVAQKLGYIEAKKETIISINDMYRYDDEELVLITTGSQGEPLAALSRMSMGEHKKISVGSNDLIIISARPIPGNEVAIGNVVDALLKKGCEVIYESKYNVHVSGHASQEELKLMHKLVKPKYFIPVHGEQKHLVKHRNLAIDLGMPPENVFVKSNGSVIELNDVYAKELPNVPWGQVLVDGAGVGDVGTVVLRDRQLLAKDGLIMVVVAVDRETKELTYGPEIMTRGFVYIKASEPLMEATRKRAVSILEECKLNNIKDFDEIKGRMKNGIAKLLYEQTKRRPMILSVVIEV